MRDGARSRRSCRIVAWGFVGTVVAVGGLVGTATAATIHASPSGDDRDDGSDGHPVRSLKRAIELADTGDTIRLAAGDYEGRVKTQCPGVTIEGPADAIIRGPESSRAIEVRHDNTTLRGLTVAEADIGIWLEGASGCVLEGLTIRDIGGEGVRIKNQGRENVVRRCRFERMGRNGFDARAGKKNGEGVYIGTAPEQRAKNGTPERPDHCHGNLIEDCTFRTEAAEAVDIKEDSEGNVVRRCEGIDSRDPDGAIFGSRGDANRFEHCNARDGRGHGFRFGGDTVPAGKYGQTETRTYGKDNVMRHCDAEGNALWGAAPMVQPQDIDHTNTFQDNGRGDVRP